MNRIGIILLGAAGIIFLIWIGVHYNNQYSIIQENPMKAVPGDAAFIIEAKRPAESLKSFFSSDFKKQLPTNSWFAYADSSVHFLDSIINGNSRALEIWKTNPIVISAHLTHAAEYDFLFLTNLPRGWTERKLKNFVTDAASNEELTIREYLDVNIYELKLKDGRTLTFASDRSVAMFSFRSVLVEGALRQLKTGNAVNETKAFCRIESAGNNELKVYFNYPFMRDFAAALSGNNNLFYSLASSFARWSGLKATTDNSSLLLNGKTSSLDSTDLINLVRFQKPQVLRSTSIAPARTAILLQFGLSDSPDFFNRLNRHSLFAIANTEKIFEQTQKDLKLDLQQYFTSWLSNEMALAITEPASSFTDNNLYVFLRTDNTSEAMNKLKTVRAAAEKKNGSSKREEKYHNCLISSIPVEGIVPLMYGRMFEGINNCYFTAINDYIVFANQSSTLKDLIDENDEQRVLEKDSVFHSSIEKLSPSSNISFYFSPQHAVNMTGMSFGTSFISLLSHSTSAHAQWINSGADISTKIVIDFGKKAEPLPVLLFSAQLDTIINTRPAIISDAAKQPFIVVQDASRSLYKIDFSGNVIWKKEMSEKIIGGFTIVDFYRDGRNQLLFNTDSLLYMLDINGENVGNYPIRLPARASNACSVTDFGKNIFIACTNQIVYAYQLNGKPLSDWNYYHTNTLVRKPIQSFVIDNIKYLVINEENEAVTYLDPKGNPAVSFKDKFVEAANSMVYYVGKDSVVGNYFVSTDTAGRVIKLFTDKEGALKAENLPKKYSRSHSFMSSDVNGDGKQDLVFLDNNEVSAFHDTSIIFQNKVADGLTGLYKYAIDGSDKVFVTSETSNRIYMINADGSVARGFPLRGALYPAFNVINQNRNILITGSTDMTLQVYELKSR